MARRSHDTIVKEYLKNYDRIRKQVERMARRGYDVSGIKPERKAKSEITAKDLKQLENLTNEKIYEKAKYQGQSGKIQRKKEQQEAAKKAAKSKRVPKKPRPAKPNETPPAPETYVPPTAPEEEKPPTPDKYVPPSTPVDTPPENTALTDEEEAALQRFDEEIDKYNDKFRSKMNAWKGRIIARVGKKAFGRMVSDAFNDGVAIPYQAAYDDLIMQDLQNTLEMYLPQDMSREDKELTEDEWQDLVDEIADDEDFPFY